MTTAPTIARPVQQSTNVADFLRLLHPPGTVFEIRAPHTSDRPHGRDTTPYRGYFNAPTGPSVPIQQDLP